MSPRCDRARSHRAFPHRGFTLIEVLAALLIAAVAITYLIQSETESIRSFNVTRDLRQATILGTAKLGELVCGSETGVSGDFEERPGWRWEAVREPLTDAFGTQFLVVTVHYTSVGEPQTLFLEQVTP